MAGLTQPPRALSFEFTTIQREVAAACIARCTALGYPRFNAALGESQTLVHADWQNADAIAHWLAALPLAANSGDIYACLDHATRARRAQLNVARFAVRPSFPLPKLIFNHFRRK